MVLLIDFDGHHERLSEMKAVIPVRLIDRVFVLGAWTEPEQLRSAGLGTYETIGRAIARGHALLRHNADEIERLRKTVRPVLFPSV